MKALVVAPQPFFTPRGTPYSVYYRTLVTAELGVQVDLLTYGEGQDVDIPKVRIVRIPHFALLGKVKTGPSSLKLFLDGFMFLWTLGMLLRNRYDFIHAHEEAVFFCRFLKPLFRFRLVYDMHSSLPQQLTNFNFTHSGLLIGLFRWLENSSLRAADAVVTICPALSDYVNQVIYDKAKHLLIENSIYEPIQLRNSTLHSTSESEQKDYDENILTVPEYRQIILYAGTLEPYQGIDLLLNAFKKATLEVPEAFLLILGGNATQVRHYQTIAQELDLTEHCHFTGRVPQNVVKRAISLASVLVSPRTEGTNTPLKIYEQLDSGKPLVATNIYSHTQVLTDDVAFLVEPEPDAFARGIIWALCSENDRRLRITNARQLYKEKYSRKVYEEKMLQLLRLVS